MSAATAKIIRFCDDYLESEAFDDWSPNGLQLAAAETTSAVVTGVSARLSLFEMAAELEANLVVCHHGILHGAGGRIDRRQAARLKELLVNDISVAQYHLPLDAHPEIGNNALLAGELGATVTGTCAQVRGRDIGLTAEFEGDGVELDDLLDRLEAALQVGDSLVSGIREISCRPAWCGGSRHAKAAAVRVAAAAAVRVAAAAECAAALCCSLSCSCLSCSCRPTTAVAE